MERIDPCLHGHAFSFLLSSTALPRIARAGSAMKLRAVGEDALLASLLRGLPVSRRVIAATGDDCAVVAAPGLKTSLVLKTDCVVEKIHFASAADPILIGWKAMMRPLSDFAAISAVPQFALVTLVVPATRSTMWIKKLYRGLQRSEEHTSELQSQFHLVCRLLLEKKKKKKKKKIKIKKKKKK